MTEILDEAVADKKVIASLLREIARLRRITEGKNMAKLLRDADGKVYMAHSFEEVTIEELQANVDRANQEAAEFQRMIDQINTSQPQAPVATPQGVEQPAAPTPQPQVDPMSQPAQPTPQADVLPPVPVQ